MNYLLICFLALCATLSFVSAKKNLYDIKCVLSELETFQETHPEQMDVWDTAPLDQSKDPWINARIYMSEEIAEAFEKTTNKYHTFGKSSKTTVTKEPIDMDKLMMEEKVFAADCSQRTRGFLNSITPEKDLVANEFFDCFRTYSEVDAFMKKIVQTYPQYVSEFQISTTYEGAPIYAYKLSKGDSTDRPAMYMQAMLHAREWLGPPTLLYTMSSLLDGLTNNDSSVASYVDKFDWYFVPIVNIDGYKYTWTNQRLWRKNRRDNGSSWWGGRTYGVDLNRNYGPSEDWCTTGISTSPSSDVYCGKSVYSEPEIKGIHEWFQTSGVKVKGGIDVHTYGNLILRPYGKDYSQIIEPHKSQMESMGAKMESAINAKEGSDYESIQASSLYPASGTFTDWLYGEYSYTPGITFELRGGNFVVSTSEILPAGREIFEGMKVFAEECENYQYD